LRQGVCLETHLSFKWIQVLPHLTIGIDHS
jgi:hypothetical protein